LRPGYRDAHDLLGNLFLQIADYSRSIDHYGKALALSPNDPSSHYHLGFAQAVSGDFLKGKSSLLKSIEMEDQRLRTSDSAISKKSVEQTSSLTHALTVRQASIAYLARLKLGEIAVAERQLETAAAEFSECLRLNPKAPLPYFEIGKIYYQIGDKSKAEDFFEKYLERGGSKEIIDKFKKSPDRDSHK